MAIDFFEHQDIARKKTGQLVFLFILAVLAIIVAVFLLFTVLFGFVPQGDEGFDAMSDGETRWHLVLDWRIMVAAIAGTLLIVGGGSSYKMAQLSGGGQVIAEHLGGRLLAPDTTDPAERKTLNVVEEMAIASGTPVPPVYFMDNEQGINAFAAGYSPSDAVIGVTRGCAEQLTRDQLQGVIAHEFSHILNGDMRLNIRLMGVIHGILIIGIIGYFIFRMAAYSSVGRRRDSDSDGRAFLILGAGLAVIGFVGTFFGNMIKAAVSRQREFLADASAVQFTRNPSGIGGALMTIGGYSSGSRIESPNAPEASHMFFGQAITSGLNSMFATHPPLPERISRVLPDWDGAYPETDGSAGLAMGMSGAASGFAGQSSAAPISRMSVAPDSTSPEPKPKTPAGSAVELIGQPNDDHIAYAHQLVRSIPLEVVNAAHDPFSARAVIYCLVMDQDPQIRQKQLIQIEQFGESGLHALTNQILPQIEALPLETRLPLIDMTIPAMRNMSLGQYGLFKTNLEALVKADEKIDLFEWSLQRILLHHLDDQFQQSRPRTKNLGLAELSHHTQVLLSALAYVGHQQAEDAKKAFDKAALKLKPLKLSLGSVETCGLAALDMALDALASVTPKLKRGLIKGAAVCVSADQQVTVHEAELLRVICDSLDCPMPPLLPGQTLV
jgi:Zn-dependent protease with chaperone function